MTELLKTPLNDAHRSLGARMVEFGGWDMPVLYQGIVEEHQAVRTKAGLFDVSHMGELMVEGPGALQLLQLLTPNDVSKLVPGRAHYTSFLTDDATFVDDLLVYRRGPDRFMVVANASNVEKDFAWLRSGLDRLASELPGPVTLHDASREIALLALQGPQALDIITSAWSEGASAAGLKYYGFAEGGSVAGRPVRIVSRTGYTGEDGFELYLDAEHATPVWNDLLERGAKPIGLGARDTLRLEAAMCLYGNDIDSTTTPVEAGLEWTVKVGKGPFAGREVLEAQLAAGTARRLVGLEMIGRGIARHGHPVLADGRVVGQVTSGTHAPTLGKAIALAYVPTDRSATGTPLEVDVRGKTVEARVVTLPFYSRKKK
jgi:aminomethyltransferase